VLAWRSRTAADETGSDEPGGPAFRGVPTFRRGIRVPAEDLHALVFDPHSGADGPVDEGELEAWLKACLALDWWGAAHRWARPEAAVLRPTLALLHPLAEGLASEKDSVATRLALGPDWAVRLAAGRVASVHVDAVRRLRQAGWEGVPASPALPGDGTAIAAALVPRCSGARQVLSRFAVNLKAEEAVPLEVTNTPELTEELS
jgi:CRISPR-associated protein Csx17